MESPNKPQHLLCQGPGRKSSPVEGCPDVFCFIISTVCSGLAGTGENLVVEGF